MRPHATLLFFLPLCGCIMDLDLSPLRQPGDGISDPGDTSDRSDEDGGTDIEAAESEGAVRHTWARSFGGANLDAALAIEAGEPGGAIVTGLSLSFGSNQTRIWTLMLDEGGEVVWQADYGSLMEKASAVIPTHDGGYLLAGDTESWGEGDKDLWILKLARDGQIDWDVVRGRAKEDIPAAVRQTSDGGFVVVGHSVPTDGGPADLLVVRLGETGNLFWGKTLGGAAFDQGRAVELTPDGGYIVAGRSSSFGSGDFDAWVVLLMTDGSSTWQKRCGGSGDDAAASIRQTLDGKYIVAGTTGSFGVGTSDFWVLQMDASGAIGWQRTYGGPRSDAATSILPTQDGGYIVAGSSDSFGDGSPDTDALVLKLDANGEVVWAKTYGAGGADTVNAVMAAADGRYVLAGETTSFGAGESDFWVLKIDGTGSIAGPCPAGFIGDAALEKGTSDAVPLQTTAAMVTMTTELVQGTSGASPSSTAGLAVEQCSGP